MTSPANSPVTLKTPVTIVTGFLGAGKTTLIRHLLENASGRRLALIVNEFGDVGVDGDILRACGIESCPEENIVELANGCICCTVPMMSPRTRAVSASSTRSALLSTIRSAQRS